MLWGICPRTKSPELSLGALKKSSRVAQNVHPGYIAKIMSNIRMDASKIEKEASEG
jgi:hypothetical protein